MPGSGAGLPGRMRFPDRYTYTHPDSHSHGDPCATSYAHSQPYSAPNPGAHFYSYDDPRPTETPTPKPTPTPTSAPTPVPTATPVIHLPPIGRPGGVFSAAAFANVPHFDVHLHVQETLASLGPGIAYSRLLRVRSGPEEEVPQPSLLLECDLCEGWCMEDPLTYRFQLRKGVLWHNRPPVDGRELIAADVVYSYERQ